MPPKQKPKISSSNASLNNLTPPVSPRISIDNVFTRNGAIEKEKLNQDSEEKINNVDSKESEVKLRRKPAETVIFDSGWKDGLNWLGPKL